MTAPDVNNARRFNIGDRVKIICPGSAFKGEETTITSGLTFSNTECLDGIWRDLWVYEVDLPSSNLIPIAFEPHELIPIYDGNEPVSWEDCIWKPTEMTA